MSSLHTYPDPDTFELHPIWNKVYIAESETKKSTTHMGVIGRFPNGGSDNDLWAWWYVPYEITSSGRKFTYHDVSRMRVRLNKSDHKVIEMRLWYKTPRETQKIKTHEMVKLIKEYVLPF